MNGEMQNQVVFNTEEEIETLKSTRLICKRPEFSDYDFIRLFFAFIYKKGQLSFGSQPSSNKRLIFLDKDYCEEILHAYSDNYVNKMDCLTDLYLEDLLLNKEKIKNILE